jgi:hypothetical protein
MSATCAHRSARETPVSGGGAAAPGVAQGRGRGAAAHVVVIAARDLAQPGGRRRVVGVEDGEVAAACHGGLYGANELRLVHAAARAVVACRHPQPAVAWCLKVEILGAS